MKKITIPFLIVVLNLFQHLNGQTTMTLRDVFDFNINDEFQYKLSSWGYPLMNMPPNAQKFIITGKRFSANNDTVIYKRSVTGYTSNYTSPPTSLTYTFYAYNDSVKYTSLSDTLKDIYKRDSCYFLLDTLYNSSSFCNRLVYESYTCGNCCDESITYDTIYGKGLGLVKYKYYQSGNNINEETDLIYYKKDTLVCGTPDTTTTKPNGISQISGLNTNISIYPNPASTSIQVTLSGNIESASLQITDMLGKSVKQITFATQHNTLNIADLSEGVYNISIASNEGVINKRLVIVR